VFIADIMLWHDRVVKDRQTKAWMERVCTCFPNQKGGMERIDEDGR
jgi:hypothetical protein